MKALALLAATLSLASCNTMIGLGRDTKEGYQWTRQKVQESNQRGAAQTQGETYTDPYSDPYGAPVY